MRGSPGSSTVPSSHVPAKFLLRAHRSLGGLAASRNLPRRGDRLARRVGRLPKSPGRAPLGRLGLPCRERPLGRRSAAKLRSRHIQNLLGLASRGPRREARELMRAGMRGAGERRRGTPGEAEGGSGGPRRREGAIRHCAPRGGDPGRRRPREAARPAPQEPARPAPPRREQGRPPGEGEGTLPRGGGCSRAGSPLLRVLPPPRRLML